MTTQEFILNLFLNLGLFAGVLAGLAYVLVIGGLIISGDIIGLAMSTQAYPYLMEHQRGFSFEYNEKASEIDLMVRKTLWRALMTVAGGILLVLLLWLQPPLDIAFRISDVEIHVWIILIIAAVLVAFIFAYTTVSFALADNPVVVVDFVSYDPETDTAQYKLRMSEEWLNGAPSEIELVCEHDEDFIAKYCRADSKYAVTDVSNGRLVFMELDLKRWMGQDGEG